MPTTSTRAKTQVDNEFDFNKKDKDKNKVTIIKKWVTPIDISIIKTNGTP